MRIGSFQTENNVFLAPMAGVTDSAFRRILPPIWVWAGIYGNGKR